MLLGDIIVGPFRPLVKVNVMGRPKSALQHLELDCFAETQMYNVLISFRINNGMFVHKFLYDE